MSAQGTATIAKALGIRGQLWMDDAACASVGDFTPWFPDTSTGQAHEAVMARSICLSCPVMMQCREYATAADELGIWGGLSRDERRGYRTPRMLDRRVS